MSAPEVTGAGALPTQRRDRLNRRSLLLAYATVGYNAVEAAVALVSGVLAGSVALVGFGLDSVVEVSSAFVVIWQFRQPLPEQRERTALRAIAVCFFALATYVSVDAARALLGSNDPDPSLVGIVLTATSLLVMPTLVWAKRRVGHELGSATVVADSTQTLLCAYLSGILLIGLVLNATLGWGWADPVAALAVAVVAVREGGAAWRGKDCC